MEYDAMSLGSWKLFFQANYGLDRQGLKSCLKTLGSSYSLTQHTHSSRILSTTLIVLAYFSLHIPPTKHLL
jgi:hypothetical protein